MPKTYKPVIDRDKSDYVTMLNGIEDHMFDNCISCRDLLVTCGLNPQDIDLERLVSDTVMSLGNFAIDAEAYPSRTPRMLVSTGKEIAHNPQKFLENTERYDPIVSAMVLRETARLSPASNSAVQLSEFGEGNGPPAEDIAKGAAKVIDKLVEKAKDTGRGRPSLPLQTQLAVNLGRIFKTQGGRITRITFVGETGKFHQFLELVLPPVRPSAKKAGFDLNVTTMVEKAQNELAG